ncbi:hypothetical protein [Vibrio algarum]|uniref:Uncharacterized protein n=1 Tax=Vibrio algarum TaxID=3020714 RepID=A0ABT4YQY8_9VIBR|nr:hypothetical protein [Vibrio sp. KJ40-1]MDB1123812.1 hypothetical protein [Vibrio sp. KJ40-1]
MSKNVDPRDQEDVVVIEQRDKHTLVYIAIAAVFGIAIGGLIGSVVTKNKWQPAYQSLEKSLSKQNRAKRK